MKKLLIFTSPITLLLEFLAFNGIAHLMSQRSDVAVAVGVVAICIDLFLNYLLIKFIIKTFSNKTI